MAEEAASVPAGREWEDLSARHAAISLPQTLDLLKTTVVDAGPDATVTDVIREVGWRGCGVLGWDVVSLTDEG